MGTLETQLCVAQACCELSLTFKVFAASTNLPCTHVTLEVC